jgi:hypothetical protein
MSEPPSRAEYLVISRGQWDKTFSRDEIQNAIDQFYTWLDRLVNEGKIKPGQRLAYEGKTIVRQNMITDGPFGESKEVIGGYWVIFSLPTSTKPCRSPKATPVWTAACFSKSGPSTRNGQRPTIPAS